MLIRFESQFFGRPHAARDTRSQTRLSESEINSITARCWINYKSSRRGQAAGQMELPANDVRTQLETVSHQQPIQCCLSRSLGTLSRPQQVRCAWASRRNVNATSRGFKLAANCPRPMNKLTEQLFSSQIVLNSMHKYQPRIHLVLWRGKDSPNLANAPISALDQEVVKTFIFSETIFTAVTAYQNHSVSSQWKPTGAQQTRPLTNDFPANR